MAGFLEPGDVAALFFVRRSFRWSARRAFFLRQSYLALSDRY
jgi:hypothetical protein